MQGVLFASGRVTPLPLAGDGAVIRFEGVGRARFRLQHARDRHGKPDRMSWADVSNLSNGEIPESQAIDPASAMVRGGVLADFVDGDTMVVYRRHRAEWLRVLPFDHHDKANILACRAYVVSLEG